MNNVSIGNRNQFVINNLVNEFSDKAVEDLLEKFKGYYTPSYFTSIEKKAALLYTATDSVEVKRKILQNILKDVVAAKDIIENLARESIYIAPPEESTSYEKLLSKLVEILKYPNVSLESSAEGAGGCFFVKNSKGQVFAVVKPASRDVGTIFNRHSATRSPSTACFCRPVDNYQTVLKEAAVFKISQDLTDIRIVPETILQKLPTNAFPAFEAFDDQELLDLSEVIEKDQVKLLNELLSPSHTTELCSVQKFEKGTKSLLMRILENPESLATISDKNFEAAFMLTLVAGDSDAHLENFLVSSSDLSALFKIDNGLCFPNRRGKTWNSLVTLPHARKKISEEFILSINEVDVDKLKANMQRFHFDRKTVRFTLSRLKQLQKLVNKFPQATYKEINLRYQILSADFGLEFQEAENIALNASKEDLKSLKRQERFCSDKDKSKYNTQLINGYRNLRTLPGGIFHSLRGKQRIEKLMENKPEEDINNLVEFYESYKDLRALIKEEANRVKIQEAIQEIYKVFSFLDLTPCLKEWLKEDLNFVLDDFYLSKTSNSTKKTNTLHDSSSENSEETHAYSQDIFLEDESYLEKCAQDIFSEDKRSGLEGYAQDVFSEDKGSDLEGYAQDVFSENDQSKKKVLEGYEGSL